MLHRQLLQPARTGHIRRPSQALTETSVGLALLDYDHQLIQIGLGVLENEVAFHKRGGNLEKTVGFLLHWSDVHFDREERLMQEIGFSGFDSHKSSHDIMRAWMEATLPELGAMRNPHYDDDVMAYLYDWWDGHVEKEDRAYADFIQTRLDEARRIVHAMPAIAMPGFLIPHAAISH
jgi:hemerythrin